MNEILILKDAFGGLKTGLKTHKRGIWVFIVSFLIGWALLMILLPSQKPAEASTDSPFTRNEVFREIDGKFCIDFIAEISFSVPWHNVGDGRCFPYELYDYRLKAYTTDFSGTYKSGQLLSNLSAFESSCTFSDSFVADQSYRLWITDDNNAPRTGYASTTIWANLRATSTEPNVDTETDLKFRSYFNAIEYTHDLYWDTSPPAPTFTITSPADGSTKTSAFDIVGTFNILAEDYDRLMIIFEDWDASSTCPLQTDGDYSTQYGLYFNSQSFPYFSTYFENATGTATTTINDLASGNYRCTRCYFINETTQEISDELCQSYEIIVPYAIPPLGGLPEFYTGQTWAEFYEINKDKWATSTQMFADLSVKVSPVLNWLGNYTAGFKDLFNNASSSAMGAEIGNAIPQARGYLTIINYYFAGLPIGEVFIFYLLTALIIIVLKIVLMIWHFFRG